MAHRAAGGLRETGGKVSPRVWRVAAVAALGPLITNLDATVVNVSLPTLGHDLHVGLSTLQWVITGYLLALALMLPLSGWLVDRFGAKRLYLACFALFTAASVLCGLSTSATALIASRIVQGMAGGLLAPMAQMMIAREAPHQLARVMGIVVVPVLLGPIFGPSLAGLILEHLSWHWIFLINLPIGVLAIAMAVRLLPHDPGSAQPRRLDLWGFALLSPGLALLLYSLESIGSMGGRSGSGRLTFAGLALSLGLLTAFVFHARRLGGAAVVDLRLFRNRAFAASAQTQFLLNAAMLGGQLLLPLFLISELGASASRAGLLLSATGLGALCFYPFAGSFVDRFGPRRVSVTGATIALLATLPFALLPPERFTPSVILLALFLRGTALGAIGLPSLAAAYVSIPRESIPNATTTCNIVQRLGGPAATTVLTLFLHAQLAGNSQAHASGYRRTFLLLCGFHALALLTTFRLGTRSHPAAQALVAEGAMAD